jgi:hypothetical protein
MFCIVVTFNYCSDVISKIRFNPWSVVHDYVTPSRFCNFRGFNLGQFLRTWNLMFYSYMLVA